MGWAEQQQADELKTGRIAGMPGGWTGRLLARLRFQRSPRPRLELLERISLAPRQSLALVEAEGRRFLVATSAEGGPAFYPLDQEASSETRSEARSTRGAFSSALIQETERPSVRRARVSW